MLYFAYLDTTIFVPDTEKYLLIWFARLRYVTEKSLKNKEKTLDYIGGKMISVIIPVYNTDETYIRRCIQSILAQSYEDFEILLVDDGSRVSCGQVLDEIEKQDARIHVWHTPNGGVSKARNFGINVARGEWICFIDSDDTVEECFFQSALEMLEDDVDLLCGKTWQIQSDDADSHKIDMSTKVRNNKIYKLHTLEEKENVIRCTILGETEKVQGMRPEVWCKLFRRSTLGELRFREQVAIGEDQIFMTEYLQKCRAVKIVNSFWYCYYIYQNSSMRKKDAGKAEKYICYFNGLHDSMETEFAKHLLPEKAANILKELLYAYGVGKNSQKEIIEEAYCAYKKMKKDKLIKKYLRRIPMQNQTVGSLEAVCCRLGFSRVGIKLMRLRLGLFV